MIEMLQVALPGMADHGWGRIVSIGSINQSRPKAVVTAYAATKAAQHNVIQSQAREYANKGVLMNTLVSGLVDTDHRGRELAYASPPAQNPACALTHGAPASDDDEGQLAKLRVFKPIAVTRETPTQSRLRKCVLHCLVGSAEWSFPPTVGICKPVDTNGGYPCWVSGTRY